jgi:hypothetical protein
MARIGEEGKGQDKTPHEVRRRYPYALFLAVATRDDLSDQLRDLHAVDGTKAKDIWDLSTPIAYTVVQRVCSATSPTTRLAPAFRHLFWLSLVLAAPRCVFRSWRPPVSVHAGRPNQRGAGHAEHTSWWPAWATGSEFTPQFCKKLDGDRVAQIFSPHLSAIQRQVPDLLGIPGTANTV